MVEPATWDLPHGIRLSGRVTGCVGQSVVMFLHGFPEGSFVWETQMAALAAHGFHCIAPDLRGFGGSSAPAEVAAYRPRHLVQDMDALLDLVSPQHPIECLVAHDWGGAIAWNLANQRPHRMGRLAILNAPHPGTFLRDLRISPAQRTASAYMNDLVIPDAEARLAEDDFARLWSFLDTGQKASWLDSTTKDRYRAVWRQGLRGGCNLYRASPLRPARDGDPGADAVSLPTELLRIEVPTRVLWGMADHALLPGLLDGLESYVPNLQVRRVEGASHWIVHEQEPLVTQWLVDFLQSQ